MEVGEHDARWNERTDEAQAVARLSHPREWRKACRPAGLLAQGVDQVGATAKKQSRCRNRPRWPPGCKPRTAKRTGLLRGDRPGARRAAAPCTSDLLCTAQRHRVNREFTPGVVNRLAAQAILLRRALTGMPPQEATPSSLAQRHGRAPVSIACRADVLAQAAGNPHTPQGSALEKRMRIRSCSDHRQRRRSLR